MIPDQFAPPDALEAEQSLLGAILNDNRNFGKVAGFLKAEHFGYPTHAQLFDACGRLIEKGDRANGVTLQGAVASWEEVGGPGYLARLIATVADPHSAESYARAVRDAAMRRHLREVGLSLAAAACDVSNGMTGEELAGELLAEAQASCSATTMRALKDRRQVMMDNIDRLKSPQRCFSTGIPGLDYCMGGGLFEKRAYGIAARRKAGKTIMAGTISYNLNAAGNRHLFVCAEMSPEEIEHRGMSRDMGINPVEFLKHQSGQDFVSRAAHVALKAPSNMFYLEAPGIKFTDLKRAIATAVSQHKITGFILDHLQLVEGKPQRQTTAEFLDEVAQWCANFARKEGLWALVMMQLNADDNTRGGEAPTLAFDQVYKLRRAGDPDNPDQEAWLEMFVSRYTLYNGVGTEAQPGLYLEPRGLYFRPFNEPSIRSAYAE